jgi:hypothetical protein
MINKSPAPVLIDVASTDQKINLSGFESSFSPTWTNVTMSFQEMCKKIKTNGLSLFIRKIVSIKAVVHIPILRHEIIFPIPLKKPRVYPHRMMSAQVI